MLTGNSAQGLYKPFESFMNHIHLLKVYIKKTFHYDMYCVSWRIIENPTKKYKNRRDLTMSIVWTKIKITFVLFIRIKQSYYILWNLFEEKILFYCHYFDQLFYVHLFKAIWELNIQIRAGWTKFTLLQCTR